MTLPLSPTTYVDGELVTAANLYARLLTPINTIYAKLVAAPQGLLVKSVRTTASGNLGGTEAMLGLLSQAAFTLTSTRRVRWRFQILLGSPSTTFIWPQINVRRNNTGAAVVTTDQRVGVISAYLSTGGTTPQVTIQGEDSELLTAGTYAYGLGISTTAGTVQITAGSEFPATLAVYDVGAT